MFLTEGLYIMQAVYRIGDVWHSLGELQSFIVEKGLVFSEGVLIRPQPIGVGQTYTATFSLVNVGGRAIQLPAIALGGRDVNCGLPACDNNAGLAAHENILLAPGTTYQYLEQRSLDKAGTYVVEPAVRMNDMGWWMPIQPMQRLTFTVGTGVAGPLPTCSMTISDGSLFTNQRSVTVRLNAPNATQLSISNDGGFVGARNMDYAGSFDWLLPDIGNRVATLIVRVRAYEGDRELCSGGLSDDIVFDSVAPVVSLSWRDTGINNIAGAQQSARMLQIVANDFSDGSGVADMRVSTNSDFTHAQWQAFQSNVVAKGDRMYVQVRDRAGNVSATAQISSTGQKQVVFIPIVTR
jgi:hypothetical protein